MGATYTYAPRIVSGSTEIDMDSAGYTPLAVLNETFTNRVRQTAVPLQNGIIIFDIRRGALNLSMQGVMNIANTTDPDQILTMKDNLRAILIGGTSSPASFTFYRHYDAATSTYRWYKGCVATDLQFDNTSRSVRFLNYSFNLICPDGIEYSQIGGAHDPDSPVITEALSGPRSVLLDESSGASSFQVLDSSGAIIFKVDSLGNVQYVGNLEQADTIS